VKTKERIFVLKLKYKKLMLLALSFVIAYFLFSGRDIFLFRYLLTSFDYAVTFIVGVFFAYGLTAAPATAILLILAKEQNIFLATLVGGLGALVGDLLIFNFIRFSLMDEIELISKEKIFFDIGQRLPTFFKRYLVPVLSGFIIASPLPDEIGVALLATSTNISQKLFFLISFTLNALGIFFILTIGANL